MKTDFLILALVLNLLATLFTYSTNAKLALVGRILAIIFIFSQAAILFFLR